MKRQTGLLSVAIIVALLFLSACSSTTPPTSLPDVDPTTPPETSAPETTSAPDTTSAPATTAPPADGESDSTTTNSTAIWAIVIIGLLLLVAGIWLAARSGTKSSSVQQTQGAEPASYGAPPPPPASDGMDDPPGTQS